MMAQIIKKLLILAVVVAILAAGYFVWIKFIRKAQTHTQSAAVHRTEKQGIKAK